MNINDSRMSMLQLGISIEKTTVISMFVPIIEGTINTL